MRMNHNGIRRLTALIMCFMLFTGCVPVPAAAEENAVTPTDLEEAEPSPYALTVTMNGVCLTITADSGVIASGEELTVEAANEDAFTQAAEAVSGIEKDDPRIVRHAQYRISGAESNICKIGLEVSFAYLLQ